jgi:hypothetical protein
MSQKQFWHDDGDIPADALSGDESDADEEVFEVDGHEFSWKESLQLQVTLKNDEHELGTAYFPVSSHDELSEEEAITQAGQLYFDLEHLRSILIDEVVIDLAITIEESGTAAAMIKEVADLARQTITVSAKADADESPEEVEEVRQEFERTLHDNLEIMVEEIATLGETPGQFWKDYARDVLAHALLWARDETIEELGEAVEQMSDTEFEAATLEAYRNAPYITQAMLTLAQTRIELLTQTFVAFLEYANDKPNNRELFDALAKKARASVEKRRVARAAAAIAPPAFDDEGYGRVTNDLISAGGRLALVSPTWAGKPNAYPVFRFGNAAGEAVYAPSEKTYPSAADAWKAVESYDDAHVDLFDYILAKMLASKASNQRDIYGDFRLTPSEVLDARGIKKHIKGGHKPENIREIIKQVDALASIEVRASVTGYTAGGKEKGKRGKRQAITLEHAVDLISIHETLYEQSLAGERIPIAWQLRPGNWARELEQFTPQYAFMMQGILKLHARRDANAKRIGRYLIYQYRVRARERSWAQPYRICDLLASAGIEVDRGNAGRFRGRIETALNILANAEEMRGPVCIQRWHYPNPVEQIGRGWLDDWLESGIVIEPPDALTAERYKAIGAHKRRPQQPRKLASGGTK